ncbi:hypothetical protein NPX13_g5123 [Xylaria arbuscula]|uniref:Uncharacterized protein n=1 Tax=Xylaria arbuscula TaxID=114810 RepID=A0A9W8NE80_9PEZI|nr:hypothetical protein NPX13_g5123 [Xylaria arbuscula]
MDELSDVEILVHIGAPSRAVHDAQYRSQAAAYLAFKPAEAIHIYSPSDQDGRQQREIPGLLGENDDESSIMPLDEGTQSFLSTQASFESVLDNTDSPRMRMHMRDIPDYNLLQQTPATATQKSWETPPSIVQDSHPLDHTHFNSLTSPTRVLENYLQYFESPSSSPRPDSQRDRLVASHVGTSQYDCPRVSRRNLVPCTQMIPCTPQPKFFAEPLSARQQEPVSRSSSNPEQRASSPFDNIPDDSSIIEETTFPASPRVTTLARADSEPIAKPRGAEFKSDLQALARASSDIGPQTSTSRKRKRTVTINFLSSHGFTYESLEIRPPEPPISEPCIDPQDFITRGLEKLGHDVGLPSRFQPREQERELRPNERGYWLLDCSSWEPRLKRDAWAFLANYIGTGSAGWGVWCRRDRDFQQIRVYCWGIVVAHIYYVLWLSSYREIVFTGCCWVDANGAQVVIMGPRSRSREETKGGGI